MSTKAKGTQDILPAGLLKWQYDWALPVIFKRYNYAKCVRLLRALQFIQSLSVETTTDIVTKCDFYDEGDRHKLPQSGTARCSFLCGK